MLCGVPPDPLLQLSTQSTSMNIPNSSTTSGAGFGPDALPFTDLAAASEPSFETRDGQVYLRGSVSRSSGGLAFPAREVDLLSGTRDMDPISFGPSGTLYAYATVHVSSSRPTPYTLGYVDFDNGIRVLAIVEAGDTPLACDAPVELRADGDRWFVAPVQTPKALA
jgi:uncharacterized protein